MKQIRYIYVGLLMLMGLVLGGCAIGGGQPAEEAAQTEVETVAERPPIPVEVSQVDTGNIAAILSYAGNLAAKDELLLSNAVAGLVEDVFVEVGDEVRVGDPLLKVVDTTFQAQLSQAQAALTTAQANLVKLEKGSREEQIALAEAGLETALANLARLEKGPRSEQVGIAQAGLDAARAQLNSVLTVTDNEQTVAASNLAQTEAALRIAQAQYDEIKWAGQVGTTPQALQLQQATIAYETALSAYNLQVNPDDTDLAALRAAIRQAEFSYALTANPFTEEDFRQARAGVRQAEMNLALAQNPFTAEDLAAARAGIAQAEAAVALAQFQADFAILRAPFDGFVAESYVSIGSSAGPQLPSFKFISTELEVKIQIPENQIANIAIDQPAALKVSAYPTQDFPAAVTNIAPAADTSSRTFPIVITPLDVERQLRAGMFANVAILLEEKVGTLLVPRSAIARVNEQAHVYVVSDDEQTVTLQSVIIGLSDPDRIEIIDGLRGEQTIVVAGVSNLSDGARIEVVARRE